MNVEFPDNLATQRQAIHRLCCIDRHQQCQGVECMAWRWMRHENGELVRKVEMYRHESEEVPVGWCGLAAFPAIGQKAF